MPKNLSPKVEACSDLLDEQKYKRGYLVTNVRGGIRRLRRAVKLAHATPRQIENAIWEVIYHHPDTLDVGHARATRITRAVTRTLGL
jgi:microcompartment protein CcmL/EutN